MVKIKNPIVLNKVVHVSSLQGNEILAKDIVGESGIILIPAGSVIKKEYISKLVALGIEEVFIQEASYECEEAEELTEIKIKEKCGKILKETIEKYFYSNSEEVQQIQVVVQDIISEILSEPEVLYNIEGIRDKNEEVYSHSLNVCTLSVIIATKLKFPKSKIKEIAVGSLLHDIGMSYLSVDIRNETYESLQSNEEKMIEVRKHVIYGYTAIQEKQWLSQTAKEIILYHHERIDGSGYPFKLKGERIKIGSQIVGLCDEFDCLVYGRYNKKYKVYQAIDYLLSKSGISFDYNLVKIFNDSVAAYPTGSSVITSDGDTAVVVRQNAKCPTRPVIRLVKDKDNNAYNECIEKDLTKELTLFIEDSKEI